MCVAGYTDSSLYGNDTDPIEDEVQLALFDKHKIRSQAGALVTCVNKSEMQRDGPVSFIVADWKSGTSHRQHVSTSSTETGAALDTQGRVLYVRALWCDAMYGNADCTVLDYGEKDCESYLITDCKSLYDHMKVEGKVPDCRHTAIYVAALRQTVVAGPGRHRGTRMLWVPSRWQLADVLTKM